MNIKQEAQLAVVTDVTRLYGDIWPEGHYSLQIGALILHRLGWPYSRIATSLGLGNSDEAQRATLVGEGRVTDSPALRQVMGLVEDRVQRIEADSQEMARYFALRCGDLDA